MLTGAAIKNTCSVLCNNYYCTPFTSVTCSCIVVQDLSSLSEPQLPTIQSVTVTPGLVGVSPNADPSIEVSWIAVDERSVSYVVRYSLQQGSPTEPPRGARQIITNGTNVILSHNLTENKRSSSRYYIWVAAQSAGGIGQYSDRQSVDTLNSELLKTLLECITNCGPV